MCDPVSLITTAVAIGSSITTFAASKSQANAQQNYQNQVAQDQANYKVQVANAANQSFIDQSYQANLRLQQEAAASSNDAIARGKEAAQARARAVTAAGEAGVSGLSIDSLLNDYNLQESLANQNSETNLLYAQKQTAENIRGMRADATSRVTGIRDYIQSPVAQPSLVSTMFDVTGDTLGGISSYQNKQNALKQVNKVP